MDKPIRVLHYGAIFGGGGVGTFLLSLYDAMDREKVQFDFVQSCENDAIMDMAEVKEVIKMGARVYSLPLVRQHPFRFKRQIYPAIVGNGIDILHCHMTMLTQLVPIKIAYSAQIPIIIHSHLAGGKFRHGILRNIARRDWNDVADNITEYTHIMNRKQLPRFNCKYFACSRNAGEAMFDATASREGKIVVLPNAIEADKFAFDPVKAKEVRNELGLENKFVIGNVARFEYQKNHEFLIEVFSCALKKNTNARLLLIGDGSAKEAIKKQAQDMGILDAVIFTGWRNDISRLVQAMDVFAFPSHFEGLGIVLVEAQAAGLPCIASHTVPIEAKILDTCEFLPLNEGAERWAEKVLSYSDGYNRRNTYDEIRNAGYDVKDTAVKMAEYYCKLAACSH